MLLTPVLDGRGANRRLRPNRTRSIRFVLAVAPPPPPADDHRRDDEASQRQ